MSKYFDIEEVSEILKLHHHECVFELDAPRKIVERLSKRTRNQWLPFFGGSKELHEEFKNCWVLSEIYCPHEGINRFNEYGINQ